MKKLLVALAALFVLSSSPVSTQRQIRDYHLSAGKLVILQNEGVIGKCSAAAVAPTRWLSAAHCNKGIIQLNGQTLEVLKEDQQNDLLLLEGPVAGGFEVSTTEPALGEEVTFVGWPGSWNERDPLLFFGRVQAVNQHFQIENLPPHAMNLFHEGGGPGDSGGPILNVRGELVGVTEAVNTYPSVSVASPTVKAIRRFLGLK